MVEQHKTKLKYNERVIYNSLNELEKDEKHLEKEMLKAKIQIENIIYIPFALHLMKERKRLKGFKLKDRIQYGVMKTQFKLVKKKLKKMGVNIL